jgi:hypothetical protein
VVCVGGGWVRRKKYCVLNSELARDEVSPSGNRERTLFLASSSFLFLSVDLARELCSLAKSTPR